MSKDRYTVESDFDDLHGDPADVKELTVDLDSDNPIIRAFVDGDEDADYVAPKDDDKPKKKADKEDDKFIDDDDEDDLLPELDDDEDIDDDGMPKKKKKGDDDDEEPEEEEEEPEEEEPEDDDKKEAWSKKVQKRIDRERDLRTSDNAESNRRISRLERENELFRATTKFDKEQSEADSRLRKLRKQKTEAIEEGETSKQVDIDDEILDIKSDRKVKQFELKQLEDGIKDETDAGGRGTPAAGLKWLDKYPQYHTNKQFQQTVLQADKMVANRGFDRNTDEYYQEIEKILRPQYPEIIKTVKTVKKPRRKAPNKKGRSAVGGTQKAGTGRTRKGVIRLTKSDQEQMEVFGMDPKNVKDVKAWADSKAGR